MDGTHRMDRRSFLGRGLAYTGGLSVAAPLLALAATACEDDGVRLPSVGGDGRRSRRLRNAGDLFLPQGFSYRVVSRQGDPMSDGNPTPSRFDGMGAFEGPGGTTVLIRNHENKGNPAEEAVIVPDDRRYDPDPRRNGGNTKLVIDGDRRVVESFAVLGGTSTNCAGGSTPWGSWISCEEVFDDGDPAHGYGFEVDARARAPVEPLPIRAAGRFSHEAVAWLDGVLYATEDRHDAAFYRVLFDSSPRRAGDLARSTGELQALRIVGEEYSAAATREGWPVGERFRVEWVAIGEPEPSDDNVREQAHELGAAEFDREEGTWSGNGRVYFNCTDAGSAGRGQVWELDPVASTLTLVYESPDALQLNHPDNIVVGSTGDLFICEDNDDTLHVRRLTEDGRIHEFARAATNESEFCGACFDPAGETLYLNQQGDVDAGIEGITYAIWGPWEAL
jgi:secreted PhoX family phosphatase